MLFPNICPVCQIIPTVQSTFYNSSLFKTFEYLFCIFFFKLDLGQAFYTTFTLLREDGLGIYLLGPGMEEGIHATL